MICSLHAQYESTSGIYNYLQFNHLKENVGIENMVVNHIYEDYNGYIWFSTETGLCRFDGHKVKYFLDDCGAQLITLQNANAFCQDSNGDILIGCEENLLTYKSKEEQFGVRRHSFTDKSHPKSITSLQFYDERIWMGTPRGLYYASVDDSLSFQPVTHANNKEQLQISCILRGPGNHLWASSEHHGLFMLKKDKTSRYYLKPIPLKGMDSPRILNLVTYDNYHLLAITDKGLLSIDSKQQHKTLLTHDKITSVNVTSSGEIWCSTFGNGLFYFKSLSERPVVYQNYSINNSTLNFINTSFVDSKDNLWIVPEKMGVRWLSSNYQFFRNHTQSHFKNGLRNNIIKDIKVDDQGRWLIGTYCGLSIYNPQKQQYEHISCSGNEQTINQIESMAFDYNGNLWIGTRNGLHCLPNHSNKMVKVKATNQQIIWNICPTSDKTGLWLGTNKGLQKIEFGSEKLTTFNLNDDTTTEQPEVVTILEDSRKRLWIGTQGEGLILADISSDSKNNYFKQKQLAHIKENYIYSLYEASDHTVWMGGQNGLYHFHNDSIDHYKGEDGKAYNIIKGIAEDHNHRIWLTTHLGIVAFDPANNKKVNFNTIDGMSSDIFNMGACQITEQGLLLAGSLKGLIVIEADSLLEKEVSYPTCYIDALSVNNSVIQAKHSFNGRNVTNVAPRYIKEIELNHNENNLSITFGFIEINHPQRIQCAYRIIEQDKHWNILPTGQNTVTLFNVPKGQYTLEYKTTNSIGHWNPEVQSIHLCILPHWSQTTQAYTVYVMIVAVLIFLLLYYQSKRIKEKENITHEMALHKQALALEKDKIEFFTNVSHELRTPLTLILAPLHELRAQKDTLSAQQKGYYINLIIRNIQMLNRLIEQLLNFSKIQNGKVRLNLGFHNLSMLVKSFISTFAEYAGQKHITISFIDNTTLSNVICDSNAIETILCNLISNAVKYSHEGGAIEVRISIPEDKENMYCISVKDEGIGISEKNLKDIFKRYARMDNAEAKSGGIGIGLAYTQSLVKLHKGEIVVKSKLNEGSCFYVYLPIKLPTEGNSALTTEAIGSPSLPDDNELKPLINEDPKEDKTGSDTLLIVEDNSDLQVFLQEIFAHRYRILLANNGKEGLALASLHLPDIIISDVMMPEMDGMEMTRRIKANYITSHIPVIMLTAKGEISDELEGLSSGANYYLKKPFLPQQLELIVKNIQKQQNEMRKRLLSGKSDISDEGQEKKELSNEFHQKVSRYICEHLDSADLNVESLSAAMNMSSVHLYRRLKLEANTTPNDLIRDIRMEKAIEMLLNKKMNVSEVAYAVGYNDPKYFSKCFKTIYGMSPTTYIKTKSSNIERT